MTSEQESLPDEQDSGDFGEVFERDGVQGEMLYDAELAEELRQRSKEESIRRPVVCEDLDYPHQPAWCPGCWKEQTESRRHEENIAAIDRLSGILENLGLLGQSSPPPLPKRAPTSWKEPESPPARDYRNEV